MKYSMQQYQAEAQRTKSGDHHPKTLPHIAERPWLGDMLHAVIGISTEAGEMLDAFKKHTFYGKPLDVVNLDEEMGDLLWYMAIYCEARGTTFEALAQRNIAKLKARYPNKFTEHDALNRNLAAERKILENDG